MSADNSLSLPPENVLYVKSTPFVLFRRSWIRVFDDAGIHRQVEPITLSADHYTLKMAFKVEQTADEIKVLPKIIGWLKVDKTAPNNLSLYCLIEAPKGLDLRELTKINNCPVVSYTGYVPECEGAVVVIKLLD